jgi:CBS domain-containing protein
MRLREIMSTNVVTIAPDEPSKVGWRRMQKEHIRHLVVVDDERVVGVLSARDRPASRSSTAADGTVAELMTARVKSATPEMTLPQAAALMQEARIGSLPVVERETLVGIVTATDVFDALGKKNVAARRQSRPRTRAARARPRRPDSPRRAPLAERLPRPVKRRAGRLATSQIPAHVRVLSSELEKGDREYVRRRLGMRLGKFADAIERVSVRIEDVNGPRGGVDQLCRIKVVLSGLPSVVFEVKDASRSAAIDGAIDGAERAVRRSVGRRLTKHRTSTSGPLA